MKKDWVIKEQNLQPFVLSPISALIFKKRTSVKVDVFHFLARDWKSPPQSRNVTNIFGKEVDLARSLFHKIACLLSEVNKYTGELSFGSLCNTLSQSAQMSTEFALSCLQEGQLSAKIDNIILFSISLNFLSDYSGIKSTNEIHVIHKEIIIKRCTNIYSRQNKVQPVENFDRFARIMSNSSLDSRWFEITILLQSKSRTIGISC